MKVFIDIETIPDQSDSAINIIAETLTVKAPDLTKPKLIELLNLDPAKDKFKTVAELKDIWFERNSESAKIEQATEQWLKTSFDGGKGQICCICACLENQEFPTKMIGTEKEILDQLSNFIEVNASFDRVDAIPYFIGHNSIKFDIPFLFKRYVINGIKPSFKLIPHARHGVNGFDTMVEWAGFGNRISMDNLAKSLGIKGKTGGMDGSKVWPEYQAGNIDKIADYCADDVYCTKEIYNRLTFNNL